MTLVFKGTEYGDFSIHTNISTGRAKSIVKIGLCGINHHRDNQIVVMNNSINIHHY